MNPDPPRQQYQHHLEAIARAEKRLYDPPEDFCKCEVECESAKDHQDKVAAFEQAIVDERLDRAREEKAKYG